MSMTEKPPRSRLSPWILWAPAIFGPLLVLAVLLLGLMTKVMELDPAVANLGLVAAVLVGGLLLLLWLVAAPMPRRLRLAGLAVFFLPLAALATFFKVENPHLFGDMRPFLEWRFGTPHDDLLESQLANTVNRLVPAGIDLSGKRPTDWAAYRGPRRDGVVVGPELLRDWNTAAPKQLWKKYVGGGHASFAVVDKVLYTMEQRRGNEAVACYDAATGEQIWAHAYATLYDSREGDKGPRATPTVADGEVYAFGATGKLTCLDARSGQVKWGPIDTLAGNANVTWGMSASPLIYQDLVIVNVGVQTQGAPNGTLVAFERASGKIRWSVGRSNAGYSSPQISTIAGKEQLVLFDGEGIAGYDPAEQGKQLWRFDWEPNPPVNVAQPLVVGDNRVFISSNYGMGCALLEVTETGGAWSVKKVWKNKNMQCKFTNPVHYQGHVYGLHNNALVCLDVQTGERKWTGSEYGNGQLLLCRDLLIIQSEDGPVVLVQANPLEERQLGRVTPFTKRTWNVPAMADGKLYVRNNREMACYELASGR
jgi:outer membrane protein assembly factor BamB